MEGPLEERPGERRGFAGRIVDYLLNRKELAKLRVTPKRLDLTTAGSFDIKTPGNIIIVSRAEATDMDDFEIRVKYNFEDAIPVPMTQVMVLGFEYTELFISWPAIPGGAADMIFGTEV